MAGPAFAWPGGSRMATKRSRQVVVINPATEKPAGSYPVAGPREVKAAVARARAAQEKWGRVSPAERGGFLRRFANTLRAHKEEYGATMSTEMGKPLKESIPEVEKCAWAADYFAENAVRFLADEHIKTEAWDSYVSFEPLGVVGSIMPWNFPFWQVARFAVPAMAAGNAIVVKPASQCQGSGMKLAEAATEAGIPEGVFQVVTGDSSTATLLIRSGVDVVSLTGSSETGVKVMREAAKHLKKVILELGGSDPFIVLEDADVDAAAKGAAAGRFLNCGQSCIAAKRFFVADAIAEDFLQRLASHVERFAVGDPLDPKTDIGPLSSRSQRDAIEAQVRDAARRGAEIVLGGKRWGRRGYFFEPTVLSDVTPEMRVLREETFGPVAPVTTFRTVDEAISQANATEYGLGAALWTRDLSRAGEFARRIQSGMVTVNGIVKSDPRLPFGGVKKSGIGRELSRYGLLEMCNIKSVVIHAAEGTPPKARVE